MIDSNTDWEQWCSLNCPDTQFGLSINNDITTKLPTKIQTIQPTLNPTTTTTENPTTSRLTPTENPTTSNLTPTENPTESSINQNNDAEKAENLGLSSFTDEQFNSLLNTIATFVIFIAVGSVAICLGVATYIYKSCIKSKNNNNNNNIRNVHGIEMQQASPLPTNAGDADF
eukprot:40938_1